MSSSDEGVLSGGFLLKTSLVTNKFELAVLFEVFTGSFITFLSLSYVFFTLNGLDEDGLVTGT